jgi:hypothetical protein
MTAAAGVSKSLRADCTAALFGVPGVLMALLKRRTLCSKADGLIRQVRSFGVFQRVREVRLSDVQLVASTYKTTRSSNFNRSGGGTEVHTVEIVLVDKQRVAVAQLGTWDSALGLGRQLAGYLGVEFQDATG